MISRSLAVQLMLEVTERSLDRDPGSLLDGLDRYRESVKGFALDDVGANTVTISMLPIIAPALIKLDMRVVREGPTAEVVRVLHAVYEESERTGATILAEGVETAAHLALARSLGAALGQGRHLGEPASLAEHASRPKRTIDLRADTLPTVATPFFALGGNVTGRARAEVLGPLSEPIGTCGAESQVPALLIILVPHPGLLGAKARRRLAKVAQGGVMTVALGPGVPADPGSGIRGTGARDHPDITGQWAVVALSTCSAAAMLARSVDGNNTEFEFGITHDRQRVIAAARSLLRRLGAPARS
jgi:hypothetical protein